MVKDRDGGIVRRVRLLDDGGDPVCPACRFLDHMADRGSSPHTLCAYGYDLKYLFTFLAGEDLDWRVFGPADAMRFLGFPNGLCGYRGRWPRTRSRHCWGA